MQKRAVCGKRAGFPFFILKNTEVIIFPKAKQTVTVNETNGGYVI